MSKKTSKDTLKVMEEMKKVSVVVGLPKEIAQLPVYDGTDLLTVGASHEFGVGVPKRSWLREPLLNSESRMNERIEKEAERALKSGNVQRSASFIGQEALNVIDDAFETGFNWRPLSQETIDKKGSSKVLVDQGILRSAITYKVEK